MCYLILVKGFNKMETTISIHWNKGAVARLHNDRNEDLCSHESHIDLINEHGNSKHESWLKSIDMVKAYEKIFGAALAEYNAKQKRSDRKMTIEQYIKSVEDDTRGRRPTVKKNGKNVINDNSESVGKRVSYEVTVKIGNTDRLKGDDGCVLYDSNGHHIRVNELPREVTKRAMYQYAKTFGKENPNFMMIGCNWHGDEGFYNKKGVWEYSTDHIHIEFIPIGHGYARGLSVQNSIGKALREMGIEDSKDAYAEWARREQKRLEKIVIEEYELYCAKHPLYAKEKGKLTIIHPVRDKNKQGDFTKEQYAIEQEQDEKEAEQIKKSQELFFKCGELMELEEALDDKQQALENEQQALEEEYKLKKQALEDEYRRKEEELVKSIDERVETAIIEKKRVLDKYINYCKSVWDKLTEKQQTNINKIRVKVGANNKGAINKIMANEQPNEEIKDMQFID